MTGAEQIVTILLEEDPYFPSERKRRIRYDYVMQLKDRAGLNFPQIGNELGISGARAHKIYQVGKSRISKPNDPFAHLTFRTRNVLNHLGHALRWPEGWSLMPDALERLAAIPDEVLLGMNGAGKFVVSEINRLLTDKGLKRGDDQQVPQPLPRLGSHSLGSRRTLDPDRREPGIARL